MSIPINLGEDLKVNKKEYKRIICDHKFGKVPSRLVTEMILHHEVNIDSDEFTSIGKAFSNAARLIDKFYREDYTPSNSKS